MSYGCVHLLKLLGADTHIREVDGKPQKCVSIPLALNGIDEDEASNFPLRFQTVVCTFQKHKKGEVAKLSLYYKDKSMYFKVKETKWFSQVWNIGIFINNQRDLVIKRLKQSKYKENFWNAVMKKNKEAVQRKLEERKRNGEVFDD